jgi:hypothetical protein
MTRYTDLDKVALPYNALNVYFVGDYCTYKNTFYKCKKAITIPEVFTPEHWTSPSEWQEIEEKND